MIGAGERDARFGALSRAVTSAVKMEDRGARGTATAF
jgi:hypothetical protein